MSEDKEPSDAYIKVELQSAITCPECGHREIETMSTDNCQFYYECKGCGVMLRPNPGDCCGYAGYNCA